ncbi:MAG: hypothetical protein V4723_13835 [Pseudomonadota bacterium]
MDSPHLARASALAALLAAPAFALACDPDRCGARQVPTATPAPASASSTGSSGTRAQLGPVAASETLARARGGADVTNHTVLGGTVSGNSATHVVSGANIIQSGSFADMAGMPIVVQNSGANVLIQNATVINLQLK